MTTVVRILLQGLPIAIELIVVAQANVCEDLKSSVGAADQEDS